MLRRRETIVKDYRSMAGARSFCQPVSRRFTKSFDRPLPREFPQLPMVFVGSSGRARKCFSILENRLFYICRIILLLFYSILFIFRGQKKKKKCPLVQKVIHNYKKFKCNEV